MNGKLSDGGTEKRRTKNEERNFFSLLFSLFFLPSQLGVRPITEGRVARMLAETERYFLGFGHFKSEGRKLGALVGTVAKWLTLRSPTAAPIVRAEL